MKRKYKIGDRIFYDCVDGSIKTAIIQDIKEESYIDDKGKEIPYQWLTLDRGDHWSIGIENYNCLFPNNPKCKNLINKYKIFDEHKDDIIHAIMEIMSPFDKCIQEEILKRLELKIK